MLAARDQENLVHGHQAAAASKPLNQGARQLPPKTPGKVPKTPFKILLNDENAGAFGGGKTGGKVFAKGNENIITSTTKGDLNDRFVTPMGPKSRAPLGAKTTNAKTKALQTPAPPAADIDPGKTNQKVVSARKAKPRISHAEMTKLEVLGDNEDIEEREIEYMPPRSKDMPDLPDDHIDLNFSMFENGGLMRGALGYFATREGPDGLSHLEREEKQQQRRWDMIDRKSEAQLQRDIDSEPSPCTHYPDCPGELCKDTVQARKEAQERYQKTIAAIDAEFTPPTTKKPVTSSGPCVPKAKAAATTLSQPKGSTLAPKATTKLAIPSVKSRLNTTLASRPKNFPTPTNPSPMRHTAATAASKTTIGYSKGRAASATLRQTVALKKSTKSTKSDENNYPDTSLAPADYLKRYGEPRFGSDMWMRCKSAGCFDEDEGPSLEEIFAGDHPGGLDALLREDAEQDFELIF